MKPLAVYPDIERLAVDFLLEAMTERGETIDAGIQIPAAPWPGDATPFLHVAVDGQNVRHPILTEALTRVTAWAHDPTEAKRLATLAQGLLLTGAAGACTSEAGPVATRDPDTNAELATFTVMFRIRSTTPPTSS